MALGFFDGLHRGHKAVIESALAEQERGLQTGVFTFTVAGSAPEGKAGAGRLLSEEQKYSILESMGVDWVLTPDFALFKDMSPEDFTRQVLIGLCRARVVCCGYDFRFGRGGLAGPDDLRHCLAPYGAQVHILPAVLDETGLPVSSSRVRQAVAEGDMPLAQALLGHPYAIDFPVAHGLRLGRRLDFPTINQHYPEGYQLPRSGVYATRVYTGRGVHCGATNVGIKPTVGGQKRPLAETYILDYAGDLYGRPVLVEFLSYIRPEQKFESLAALREAIAADAQNARVICGQGECERDGV